MKTIPCVRAVPPQRCPKRGFSRVNESTVETGMRCSFRLKADAQTAGLDVPDFVKEILRRVLSK
jgi:hypothetical protein